MIGYSGCTLLGTQTSDVGILGIRNRTENWKTAEVFCGLSEEKRGQLAAHLASRSAEALGKVRMELFWQGVRDWLNCELCKRGKNETREEREKKAREKLWNCYTENFNRLREEICSIRSTMKHPKIRCLKDHQNYSTNKKFKQKLVDNLRNTEIDIVLQTSDFLFIGEAKHESSFHASSEFVLVHQLVRQYVMAKTLLDVTDNKRRLVPFVIGDCPKRMKGTSQVNLMTQLKCPNGDATWMDKRNVLSWECLEDVAGMHG